MRENNNDFFDFDMDTNIFEKLENDKISIKESSNNSQKLLNKKRKSNINSSWSYGNVLSEEKKIQKIKETKKIKELGLSQTEKDKEIDNEETEPKQNSEMPLIEENEQDSEDENPYFKDKFENALFAKGMSFTNFNLSKLIIKALSEMEYYTPTKVQEKVIPIALNGHDIFVNSETGSGKTACFLLPIVQRIIFSRNSKENKKNKNENNIIQNQALIIVPTRELALQCNEMLTQFLKYIDLNFVFLCGGLSVENQLKQMKNKIPDIIITTPGRLLDLIYNNKNLSLEHVNILVLDEADKLLELGFKDAIFEILELIKKNKNRQTLLFSATLNPKLLDLGEHALNNPIKIKIAQSAILTNLSQSIIRIKFANLEQNNYEKRMAYLLSIIKQKKLNRTIIFFNTKQDCHKCILYFSKFGLDSCVELHGDKSQTERIKSLEDFQKGNVKFLIATDIAGRGIDIEKVKCVINFQMPLIGERYIHRVGRTARKGYVGEAITICDDKERLLIKKIFKKEKVDIKVKPIKINNDEIKDLYKKIIKIKDEIDNKIIDEKAEKQFEMAEKDIEKTMNIKLHQNEIKNRPKKIWYETTKEKRKKAKKLKKEFEKKKKDLYEDLEN
jgi:ATP-dependent RNA helicase DDX27